MKIKKVPSHREKINLLRALRTVLLSMITCSTIWESAPSYGQNTPAPITERPCGRDTRITLPLGEVWQESVVRYPSVLCAFRNENGGFPTLNIIQDASRSGPSRPGVLAIETEVKNEYEKVGLTDAVISESHMEPLGTTEAFHTTARYMNQGIPMESLIMIVLLPERTITVTVLDRADHPLFSKTELQGLLRGVRIEGATEGVPQPMLTHNVGYPAVIFLIASIGVFLIALGIKQAASSKR